VSTSNPSGTAGITALYWTLYNAGHAPLRWGPPNGYPDSAAAWASPSGALVRWTAHLNLAGGWSYQQLTRPASPLSYLVPNQPGTYGGLVDALCVRLLGRTMQSAHRTALLDFLGKRAESTLTPNEPYLVSRFPYLVAVVLDSPYFATR
jgi:hypothetical protein